SAAAPTTSPPSTNRACCSPMPIGSDATVSPQSVNYPPLSSIVHPPAPLPHTMAAKDFAPIETDYAFFMAHATEAESDAAEYLRELAGFAEGRASIRMLDFGCGTGEFTERLASALNWPPQALRMTLVEPVRHQCDAAVRRLTCFSRHPIESLETL